LLRIPAFISETNWTPLARSPFSDLVYNAIGYTSITAHIVGTILIFFQAIIINSMMNSNRITKESSLFPGLLFVLLQTLIPDFNYLSPAMMANTFLVMALWNISTSYKKTGKSGEIFNTGIFIGIAMLFDISYFVFLVCGFVGFLIVRSFRFIERIQYLIGFFIPIFLGGAWNLTMGMAGFGIALALPFALFAAFPGWMNSIPKSGGWLNTVKVVLGFIEVALAFKFLSNADLVKHWGLLKIEPFLLIWIAVAVGLFAYMMGWIRFPHDSKLKKLSPVRGILALASLAFAIYLAMGFMYNKETKTFTSLSLLSGLAPPVGYSILYPKDCPNNLNCFHDLQEGLAYAKSRNLPIFLDFTGYACVNCRKMEEHVWPKDKVNNLLTKEYVVISLYVDDKTPLPENEQVTLTYKTGGKKRLRTVGDKWQFFQTDNFNNNSQPWYALITHTGQLLNTPVGYTPDVNQYVNFLQCGLDAYKSSEGKGDIGIR